MDTKQVFHTNFVLLNQEYNNILATVRNTQKRNCFPLTAEGKSYPQFATLAPFHYSLAKIKSDVIGMVTDYGNMERASSGAQKMDIMLINEREKKMAVTLWEEKAKQFQDACIFADIYGFLAKSFAENGCRKLRDFALD
ncbi:hypothetical protein POM88_045147 [Heracleum sosnowskyi]|uniref:Uncharacterized protein n=1 Tax=Heracleum sosnowskyi TaxID=360622 RepID=A0AAD8H6J9_9APIA|nr:hypothetical protein POM88_045147 [Heracleum sosnowskyi]